MCLNIKFTGVIIPIRDVVLMAGGGLILSVYIWIVTLDLYLPLLYAHYTHVIPAMFSFGLNTGIHR
jgi:hypothetical protein